MDRDTFKRICKEHNCIYSNLMIERKLDEINSFRRWEYLDSLNIPCDVEDVGVFYNRIEHQYLDTNFEYLVVKNDRLVLRDVFEKKVEVEYFTTDELNRINRVHETYNLQEQKQYGFGDGIYNRIGVLKDGSLDDSPTIGVELEIQYANCIKQVQRNLTWFNYNLGHLSSDSSIRGYEFDTHIFTYNKFLKCKPLFAELLTAFANKGLTEHSACGCHVHIGRRYFKNDEAFKTFYYLINSSVLRNNWFALARRQDNNYCRYSSLEPNNLNHINNSINAHLHEHGVAVNQEHRDTIEIRIFNSTLSVDILYGYVSLIVNLLEFCNSEDNTFNTSKIYKGDAVKLFDIIGLDPNGVNVDVSFIKHLTIEQLAQMIKESVDRGDYQAAAQLSQRAQTMMREGAR